MHFPPVAGHNFTPRRPLELIFGLGELSRHTARRHTQIRHTQNFVMFRDWAPSTPLARACMQSTQVKPNRPDLTLVSAALDAGPNAQTRRGRDLAVRGAREASLAAVPL